MSGYVEVEGHEKPPIHPALGRINGDVRLRRAMEDIPPVAWFTSQLAISQCLIVDELYLVDQNTGAPKGTLKVSEDVAHGLALHRIALAFPIAAIPVVRWPDHLGFATEEGRALNASARGFGDNPND